MLLVEQYEQESVVEGGEARIDPPLLQLTAFAQAADLSPAMLLKVLLLVLLMKGAATMRELPA